MMKLGICTAGCEQAFEDHLRDAYENATGLDFTYVEVGIASGETLLAVTELMDTVKNDCRIIGIDVPECPVFIEESFMSRSGGKAQVKRQEEKCSLGLSVFLLPGGVQNPGVAEALFPGGIDFAFIDGCHGKSCAIADFLALEKLVNHRGIVVFHDACEADQGSSWQGHCGEMINVRAALKELGLLDGARAGWKLLEEVQGDKTAEIPGNGMCFFERG